MARHRALITTPYPSVNSVAKLLGVPRNEVEAVKAMVHEIIADLRRRGVVKQRQQRRRKHGKPA